MLFRSLSTYFLLIPSTLASTLPPIDLPTHPLSKRDWTLLCDPLAFPTGIDPQSYENSMTNLCSSPLIGCYCDGPDTLCWPRDSPPPTSSLPPTSQLYIQHGGDCFASCDCWDIAGKTGSGKENRMPRPPRGVPSWSAYHNGGVPAVRQRGGSEGDRWDACLGVGAPDVCTQDGDCCEGGRCVPHGITRSLLMFGLEAIVHVGGCLADG